MCDLERIIDYTKIIDYDQKHTQDIINFKNTRSYRKIDNMKRFYIKNPTYKYLSKVNSKGEKDYYAYYSFITAFNEFKYLHNCHSEISIHCVLVPNTYVREFLIAEYDKSLNPDISCDIIYDIISLRSNFLRTNFFLDPEIIQPQRYSIYALETVEKNKFLIMNDNIYFKDIRHLSNSIRNFNCFSPRIRKKNLVKILIRPITENNILYREYETILMPYSYEKKQPLLPILKIENKNTIIYDYSAVDIERWEKTLMIYDESVVDPIFNTKKIIPLTCDYNCDSDSNIFTTEDLIDYSVSNQKYFYWVQSLINDINEINSKSNLTSLKLINNCFIFNYYSEYREKCPKNYDRHSKNYFIKLDIMNKTCFKYIYDKCCKNDKINLIDKFKPKWDDLDIRLQILKRRKLKKEIDYLLSNNPMLTAIKYNNFSIEFPNYYLDKDTKLRINPIDNNRPDLLNRTIIIKAGTDTGKSYALYEYLKKSIEKKPDLSVLIIYPYISLCMNKMYDDLTSLMSLGFHLYNEPDFLLNSSKYQRIIITLNSLTKLNSSPMRKFDYVILDEISMTLNFVYKGTIPIESVQYVWNIFSYYISVSKTNIVLCQDIKNKDMETLAMIDPNKLLDINIYTQPNDKIKYIFHFNKESILNELQNSISKEKHRCFIVGDTLKKLRGIKDWIENTLKSGKVGFLNGVDTDMKEILSNTKNWDSYSHIMLNQAGCVGISKNKEISLPLTPIKKEFNIGFAFFENPYCLDEMRYQLMRRLRFITSGIFHIYIVGNDKNFGKYIDDEYNLKKAIIENTNYKFAMLNKNNKNIISMLNPVPKLGLLGPSDYKLSLIDNSFNNNFISNELKHAKSLNRPIYSLKSLIISKNILGSLGVIIKKSQLDSININNKRSRDSEIVEVINQNIKDFEDSNLDNFINCDISDIDDDLYNLMKNSNNLSKENKLKKEKYEFFSFFNLTNETCNNDFIKKYNHSDYKIRWSVTKKSITEKSLLNNIYGKLLNIFGMKSWEDTFSSLDFNDKLKKNALIYQHLVDITKRLSVELTNYNVHYNPLPNEEKSSRQIMCNFKSALNIIHLELKKDKTISKDAYNRKKGGIYKICNFAEIFGLVNKIK